MRLIEHVLGSRVEGTIRERLHRLEHHGGRIDRLVVASGDIERRRFRAKTAGGEDVAIALPRDATLFDGAVLALEDGYALLVETSQPRWLRCVPHSVEAALELAHSAGHLHWRVQFDGAALLVAQEGPIETYTRRLQRMLDAGSLSIEPAEEP